MNVANLYKTYARTIDSLPNEKRENIRDYVIHLTSVIDKLRAENKLQPCSHPLSAIVTNGTTSYCGVCADESLRENISKGVEA